MAKVEFTFNKINHLLLLDREGDVELRNQAVGGIFLGQSFV